MNIAVSKGAAEGLKFIEYVKFLEDNNYLPPDGKEWADHIRKTGNIATHEIKIMDRPDAEELLRLDVRLDLDEAPVLDPADDHRLPVRVPGGGRPGAGSSMGSMTDTVHNRIAMLRAERGVSRRELSEALGVHYQTIGYLERGEYSPSLFLALKIADYFEVPLEVVFSTEPFARIGSKASAG